MSVSYSRLIEEYMKYGVTEEEAKKKIDEQIVNLETEV